MTARKRKVKARVMYARIGSGFLNIGSKGTVCLWDKPIPAIEHKMVRVVLLKADPESVEAMAHQLDKALGAHCFKMLKKQMGFDMIYQAVPPEPGQYLPEARLVLRAIGLTAAKPARR